MELVLEIAKEKMEKSIEALKGNLATIRTGRASASLLDRIEIDYYGTSTPINQLATVSIPEPRQLVIKPYDKDDTKAIVGAINASDLGINPINDGNSIRLMLPPLTEERRKELAKVAKKYTEDGKIAIRNIRRDAMDEVKKDKELPEDTRKNLEEEIQKLTDTYVRQCDDVYQHKEKEILTI